MSNTLITVFEWGKLRVGTDGFSAEHFDSLVKWQDMQNDRYFNVGHRQIGFTQWVGVLRIGTLIIEVLPKPGNDKSISKTERPAVVEKWRRALVDMLKKTGKLHLRSSNATEFCTKRQNLFDIYYQAFLDETETLIHRGLIKKYRLEQRNRNALKGKMLLQKHFTKNIIHQERFFSEASEFDRKNIFNEILLAALRVTARTAQNGLLRSRASNLSFHFPDWDDRKFTPSLFERIKYDRKTRGYKEAIRMAELIILNLNPQIKTGAHKVLAIFFDMNHLWESWLLATYQSTYRTNENVRILGKQRRFFWRQNETNTNVSLEPDIVVEIETNGFMGKIILDAKWKVPGRQLNNHDLRQMFAYNLQWESKDAWLIYPAAGRQEMRPGAYVLETAGNLGTCFVNIFDNNDNLVNKLRIPSLNDYIPI